MAVARIFNKLLFRTRRFFFYPYLIIDSLLYLKYLICISTVHLYRQLCLIISSLTCSALGCLMNMWTYRPPGRWAHGLLWWPRTAITNVVSCLVKILSLFLYCLSEIKFTTTTTSCPRNNAWQMALRCFAKCPYRAHRWDIRQGEQEEIWRYCGKLHIRGPNHNQLGPYEPGTLAGSAHQVNGVP